jgi:hypothetical protein
MIQVYANDDILSAGRLRSKSVMNPERKKSANIVILFLEGRKDQ